MMNLKLSIILLFLTIWGHPLTSVQAQSNNPTPQPDQAFIRSWTNEVIFPSAVRFTITIVLPPSEISAATLIINPETRPAITIPMDLGATIVIGGDVTEIAYVWQLPPDTPPLLFRDITFDWEVTSTSAQSARIEDTFTFTDPRANWLRDIEIDSSLKITLPNGLPTLTTPTPAYSRTGIDEIKTNLKRLSSLLTSNVGNIPAFNVLIYDKQVLPLCSKNAKGALVAIGLTTSTEVSCDPAVADKIFTDSGYAVLQIDSSALGNIESAVSEYIVRKSYESLWLEKDVPEWFQAGLALFYSPALKAELSSPLFNAARTNNLFQLDVMAKTPSTNINNDLWKSESYGLVVYIASEIGVDGLYKLSSNTANETSFATAYNTATGKPIETLLESFRSWLFSDEALSAFTFTPYQAATPSPTASRTPTATRKPIPTGIPTLTFTPTVTGVLSITPLPSKTATLTPTAAPATNTPRPAGSLNTPTPVPALRVPEASTLNRNLTIGLLIFIIGAIVAAIAVLVVLRPKR